MQVSTIANSKEVTLIIARDAVQRAIKQGNLLEKAATCLIAAAGYSNANIGVLERRNKYSIHLNKKYGWYLAKVLDTSAGEKVRGAPIWFCWLQGLDHAPSIVKACFKQVQQIESKRNIAVVTKDNFQQYVALPEHILSKWHSGIISNTHFSDILRLQLLIEHGGIWMDATVYLTGEIPRFMESKPLFMYRHTDYGDTHFRYNSWFISSYKGNGIMRTLQALLLKYWEDNNKLKEYFLWHVFLSMIVEKIPEFDSQIYPVTDDLPEQLRLVLFDRFDETYWDALKGMSPIHKLSYKIDTCNQRHSGTYYQKLLQFDSRPNRG